MNLQIKISICEGWKEIKGVFLKKSLIIFKLPVWSRFKYNIAILNLWKDIKVLAVRAITN